MKDEQWKYGAKKDRSHIKREFILHRNIYTVCMIGIGVILVSSGVFAGTLGGCILAWLIIAACWGIGLGCHFASVLSRLKCESHISLEQEVKIYREKYGELPEKVSGEAYKPSMKAKDKHLEVERDSKQKF